MAQSLEARLDNSGNGPIKVPGFNGLSLYFSDLPNKCGHDAAEWSQERLTAREVAMLGVMNALTDKPSWSVKVFDDAVVARWREEALTMPQISDKAWEWCLDEMRDKASLFEETGYVLALDSGSRVCKSDTLVSPALQREIKGNVMPLLSTAHKDWHPGSNGQVLNLVHPSLFPLVYGQTRVLSAGGTVGVDDFLNSCGLGETAPTYQEARPPSAITDTQETLAWQPVNTRELGWSKRFQWLPADVEFAADAGTEVRFVSYINNLHPRHQELYRTIEKIVSLAIEPWNETLAVSGPSSPLRIRTYAAAFEPTQPDFFDGLRRAQRNKDRDVEEYKKMRDKVAAYIALPDKYGDDYENIAWGKIRNAGTDDGEEAGEDDPDDSEEDDEDDPDDEETIGENWEDQYGLSWAAERKWKRMRSVVHPEPGVAYTNDDWKTGRTGNAVLEGHGGRDTDSYSHTYHTIKLQDTFRHRGLQVIVKLASIELTPDKPSYPGGSWHIEGMLNEHIAATAIYYYDVDNVTPSRILFRSRADLDDTNMDYAQNDHAPLAEIFGVESGSLREEPAVQELGSVNTPNGRLLVFPNTLQHRVSPFELVDKTRPGHRRFLVLWLVDPHYRICSTRNVPPQRHDWWAERGLDKVDFRPLPMEVIDMVRDEVGDWPMGLEEAERLRLELMNERTMNDVQMEAGMEEYNFCEH